MGRIKTPLVTGVSEIIKFCSEGYRNKAFLLKQIKIVII